jgi:hypothetical protein
MIPITVSDALKVLENIPIWKQLRELPKRLTALEQRIAVLEQERVVSGKECPLCGAEMKVVAERHPQFAFAGKKIHQMECSCGNQADRIFKPGRGYK